MIGLVMEQLRKEIDDIDRKIIELLAKRFSIAKEIAKLKKDQNLPIQDKEREEEVIKNAINNLKANGFDDAQFAKDLYAVIMKKSKEVQE